MKTNNPQYRAQYVTPAMSIIELRQSYNLMQGSTYNDGPLNMAEEEKEYHA